MGLATSQKLCKRQKTKMVSSNFQPNNFQNQHRVSAIIVDITVDIPIIKLPTLSLIV